MAVKYYDDLLVGKLKKWIPSNSKLRVLKPEESKRYFELNAADTKDEPLKLPCMALSRNNDIELYLNVKNPKSYDGIRLTEALVDENGKQVIPEATGLLNVIPIKVMYQLDIYTKTAEEGDAYVREFLFKLINNPTMRLLIPYNANKTTGTIDHRANIRVLSTISDTSGISERIFSGQFTRWTIQLELQDAFLFSVPYRKNWRLYVSDDDILPEDECSVLELATSTSDSVQPEVTELLDFNLK